MANIVRVLTFIDKSGGEASRRNHKPFTFKHLKKSKIGIKVAVNKMHVLIIYRDRVSLEDQDFWAAAVGTAARKELENVGFRM